MIPEATELNSVAFSIYRCMKHIKNFKSFINESNQSFSDTQKEKNELDKLGKFEIFIGKQEHVAKFMKECTADMLQWIQDMSETQIKVYLSPNNKDLMRSIGVLTYENGLMKTDLNSVVCESVNWMVLSIPKESEWEITDGSYKDSKVYKIKKFDSSYVIPADKLDWFKENIGKDIKFKYNPEGMMMQQVSIVKNL